MKTKSKDKKTKKSQKIILSTSGNNALKREKLLRVVLACVCVVLLCLVIIFVSLTYHQYVALKNHRDYFKQSNLSIQDWMTVRSVVRHYNLSEKEIYAELNVSPSVLYRELGIDNSTAVDRLTIKMLCVRKHVNCTVVVNRLNSIKSVASG